jgi:hypothetical protein
MPPPPPPPPPLVAATNRNKEGRGEGERREPRPGGSTAGLRQAVAGTQARLQDSIFTSHLVVGGVRAIVAIASTVVVFVFRGVQLGQLGPALHAQRHRDAETQRHRDTHHPRRSVLAQSLGCSAPHPFDPQ